MTQIHTQQIKSSRFKYFLKIKINIEERYCNTHKDGENDGCTHAKFINYFEAITINAKMWITKCCHEDMNINMETRMIKY